MISGNDNGCSDVHVYMNKSVKKVRQGNTTQQKDKQNNTSKVCVQWN